MIYERAGDYYSEQFMREKAGPFHWLTRDELDELEARDMTDEQRRKFWARRRQFSDDQ